MPTEPDQERVVLLAPVGRDASLLKAALSQAAFACQVVADAQELRLELRETAGALLLTEEALTPPVLQSLQAFLATYRSNSLSKGQFTITILATSTRGKIGNRPRKLCIFAEDITDNYCCQRGHPC